MIRRFTDEIPFAAILSLTCLVVVLLSAGALSAEKTWNFLPTKDIGVQEFLAAHPEGDGRGVVVAILDTGVDALAPGLLTTTTGTPKIIEVRDFSSQGDWETTTADLAEDTPGAAPVFQTEDGLQLRGADSLPVPPIVDDDPDHQVYIGVISEQQFLNSPDVYDLNDDGDNADHFGFIVYQADRAAVEAALGVGRGFQLLEGLNETARQAVEQERRSARVWVVAVDADGNGDLADEALLRDFHTNHDLFTLGNDNAPDARTLMAWELNVRHNEDHLGAPLPPTVEFHFDDGSHGSHCAGIATGYEVSGQPGLNGVAPGAWIMSLKIGDNRLSGGATRTSSMKKAYEYAVEFGEKYGLPVVVNMSFGISSVQEGDDAMGGWLNDLLAENPGFFVCTSAGNEGPGLSTVGLPATAFSVISSGAYFSPETAKDLYSAQFAGPTLFNFSSRGAESCKPDIVAPGSAMSTVPGFVDGMARYNGTSMASPQTAGAVACLVGAAHQEGLDVHWGMVKRALIAGGNPVPGLILNDQGGGLINLPQSWQVLEKLARSKSAQRVLWYEIETACPFQDDGLSEAAYWRTPQGTPVAPETVIFTVHPVFHPDLTPDQKDTFFRSFKFQSEADWLEVVSGDRYIRGDMGMTVTCKYDGKKLAGSGVHSGRIIASLDGGDLGGLAAREFYLWNTVVIGDVFGPDTGYRKVYQGKDLIQSSVHRYHVDVPPGASAMRVRLEVSPEVGSSPGARALTEICDPEGHVHGNWAGYARVDRDQIKTMTVLAPELYPGTWEVNVASSIYAGDLTDYSLSVAFDGYQAQPGRLTCLPITEAGQDAESSLTVTRIFPGSFRGGASARVEGFAAEKEIEISDADEWTHSFTLDQTTPRAEFHLVMDKKTGNLFTDCAVNILDSSGEAVTSTGFDGLVVTAEANLSAGQDQASFRLQVVGAFALAEDMADWGFNLEEKYLFSSPLTGSVQGPGQGPLRLYCGVPTDLSISFADSWPECPEGLAPFGVVVFRDEATTDRRPGDTQGTVVLEVPILLE